MSRKETISRTKPQRRGWTQRGKDWGSDSTLLHLSLTPQLHRLIPIKLDVSDVEQIDRAYIAVSSYLAASNAHLAAVINVAGGALVAPLEVVRLQDYRYLLDLELVARHEIPRVFMPLLRQNQGRAVNVGSVGAWNFSPGFGVYHVVKAAVHAETMVLRKEMAKFGVAVSLIEPGWYPSGSTLDLIR